MRGRMLINIVNLEDASQRSEQLTIDESSLGDVIQNLLMKDLGLHYDVTTHQLTVLTQRKGTYTPCSGCDQYLTGPHACTIRTS